MRFASTLAALAAATVLTPPAFAADLPQGVPVSALVKDVSIPYSAFTLKNGLRVIVHEDHKAPVVAVSVWYHVGSKDEPVSEAVLRNIRVLAIGQEIEMKDGDKVAAGKTATLEVTPQQAETLALAQSMGEISLSLRSLADTNPATAESTAKLGDRNTGSVKYLKYGVPSRAVGIN